MKKLKFLSGLLILWLSLIQLATAQDESAKRQKQFNLSSQLAIQGYDPVGYFVSSKAVKGKKEFQYTHKGVKYYFANQTNLNTFKQNPDKYEPAYGGWCAYAIGAKNDKVSIDPGTFKIKNGKLFLFYNSWGTNTLNYWNDDEANLYKKAESNWKKIYN
ncbi:MAG: YHS domain-containing protein [Microscillaceae bacterium]|jgi:YHS domain-containing protein|nr:YHS domain-containing protein [Microscillaceae bacterium]